MGKARRVLSIFVAAVLYASLFSGCEGLIIGDLAGRSTFDKPPKVKLSIAYNWMGQDAKAPAWEARLIEFQDANADSMDLEMIRVAGGGPGIRNKIQTDFAANCAADFMVFYDGKEILPYVKNGYLTDLTDIIRNDAALKDRFIEGTLDTATFDDRIYGVPLVQAALILYANRKLFNKYGLEYPITNDDLKNCARVFKENNIVPIALGNKANEKSVVFYSAFSQRILKPDEFKKASYSENGVTFLDERFIKTAEYMMEWAKLGVFSSDVNSLEKFNAIKMFSDEKAAMLFEGSWAVGSIKKELINDVDPILMPVFPETIESGSLCGFTEMSLIVSQKVDEDSGKKPYISELIKFVTDPAFVKSFGESSGSVIPTVKGVRLESSNTNPLLVKVTELFNKAKIRGPRLFSYTTPGQMVALSNGVSRMLGLTGTPESNMKLLADITQEENGR